MLTEAAIRKQLADQINEGGLCDLTFRVDFKSKTFLWFDTDEWCHHVNGYRIEGDKVIMDAMPTMSFETERFEQ